MLQFKDVTKTYTLKSKTVHALDRFSLTVPEGEFVVIKGESGCGKTTLLLTAGGMLRPTDGTVAIGGQDLYAMKGRDRAAFRATSIGFVFQMFHLVPYLTVLDNVLLAATKGANGDARAHAVDLLQRLGLGDRTDHTPAELSAGERQRTAIARALLNRPKLILADEPTGNLDPENSAEVIRHLSAYHQEGGAVLLVTHGTDADEVADRIVRVNAGQIDDLT